MIKDGILLASPPWGEAAEPEKLQEMVFIKGGCFEMGDTFGEGQDHEVPVHEVCVDDFFMDKYEVSQKKFLAALGFNPSRFTDCENCPVESLTTNAVGLHGMSGNETVHKQI